MYSARDKEEVLEELNTFLNDSIVLPPGEYGADHILPKSLQVWLQRMIVFIILPKYFGGLIKF